MGKHPRGRSHKKSIFWVFPLPGALSSASPTGPAALKWLHPLHAPSLARAVRGSFPAGASSRPRGDNTWPGAAAWWTGISNLTPRGPVCPTCTRQPLPGSQLGPAGLGPCPSSPDPARAYQVLSWRLGGEGGACAFGAKGSRSELGRLGPFCPCWARSCSAKATRRLL